MVALSCKGQGYIDWVNLCLMEHLLDSFCPLLSSYQNLCES